VKTFDHEKLADGSSVCSVHLKKVNISELIAFTESVHNNPGGYDSADVDFITDYFL